MKILLFANTDWYLYNFRKSLALALLDAGHDVLMLSPPGAYGMKFQELGLRWISAPMERRSLDPFRELRLLMWLVRLLRHEKVDLVHGFTIKCAVYGSIAARLAGARGRVMAIAGMGYVFTSQDTRARLLRPLLRGLMRIAFGGTDARVILQNPDDLALIQSARLVSPSQVRLIPGSGVDCQRFTPRAPDPTSASRPLCVVLPARLLWDKGVAEYVEAARILHTQGYSIRFLLAGEPDFGNPSSVSDAQVRRWSEEGLIEWLGHVSDMPALFASADVVALPSYREGLPKGLIEAGASGLALITTDAPGCREVVCDGVDGLLVPVKDAAALARAIARLDKDAELRIRLGAAARRKAVEQFDERLVISQTIAVYHELVEQDALSRLEPKGS